MWIDNKHRVFANVMAIAVLFVVLSRFDQLAWWQEILFVMVPLNIGYAALISYMGWFEPRDGDSNEHTDERTSAQRFNERFGGPRQHHSER